MELRAMSAIIPTQDCFITMITRFLFKNWEGNSKHNVGTSFDLTSKTRYDNAKLTINIFRPTKVSFISAKQRQMHYNDLKMSYDYFLRSVKIIL